MKPNQGNMGIGVSVGMRTNREVRDAFERARQCGRAALVEEYVPGADYRLLVIDGKLEAAARRVPAHVVGDGVHTIEELVRGPTWTRGVAPATAARGRGSNSTTKPTSCSRRSATIVARSPGTARPSISDALRTFRGRYGRRRDR